MGPKEICLDGRRFTLKGSEAVKDARIRRAGGGNGVDEYEIRLTLLTEGDGSFRLTWSEPMLGILGFWSPGAGRRRELHQWWAANTQVSSVSDGAPVIALFRQGGLNYRTAAVSEAERRTKLSVCVNDFAEKEALDFCVTLFEDEAPPGEDYTFYLRVDGSERNLSACIGDVGRWWERFYPPQKRPEANYACVAPLYSTWYAYHQDPRQETLIKELPLAKALGFGAMTVDDGWSYAGPGTGDYRYCGTWTPDKEKFPDLAGFIKKAKACGIYTAFWFSVPFTGLDDPNFTRLQDRFLCVDEGLKAGVLDPRFPEVRYELKETYARFCEQYGAGGLKLDFITDLERPAPPKPGCEPITRGEAVKKLLTSLDGVTNAPENEAMVEFRQYYMGPSIARHCNMLRVCDCAFDVVSNRVGTADLRMLGYPLAVHSDMLLWAKGETPENCAVMLQNILFAVPQISVELRSAPPEQLAVIKNHLAYFNAHRELLVFGRLTVYEPEANYAALSAENDGLRVIALYAPRPVRFDGKTADVFNAAAADTLVLSADAAGTAECFDCFGALAGVYPFAPGSTELPLPRGGRARLTAAAAAAPRKDR